MAGEEEVRQCLVWADLLVLAGTVAYANMGLKVFGFGFGRKDIWGPEIDINWGNDSEILAPTDERVTDLGDANSMYNPLAASHMGLIYVNPEGVNGSPDPAETAKYVRMTFARMAMNDEETAALTVGGHTVGKAHGGLASDQVGPEPAAAGVESAGFGWADPGFDGNANTAQHRRPSKGRGRATRPSGTTAISTCSSSTSGKWEVPRRCMAVGTHRHRRGGQGPRCDRPVDQTQPDNDRCRHGDEGRSHLSRDLRALSTKTRSTWPIPSRAWFKLTHRDMGPRANYYGPFVPAEDLIWQDPVPAGPIDYDVRR